MSESLGSTKVESVLLLMCVVALLATAACAPDKTAHTPPELAPANRISMEYMRDQYGFVCYAKQTGYSSPPIVVPMSACLNAESAEPRVMPCDTDTECMQRYGGDGSPLPRPPL